MRNLSAFWLALSFSLSPAGNSAAQDNKDLAARSSELNKDVIADFAQTVSDAIEILRTSHVKQVSRDELLRWAIEGLYSGVSEEIPGSLADRLGANDKVRKSDVAALLSDARKHLGRRRSLESLKDTDLALASIFRNLEPDTRQQPQKELRATPWCVLLAYSPTGIGVRLVNEPRTGQLQVVTTIKDGPAYQAKVFAKDGVTAIMSEDAEGDSIVRRTLSSEDFSVAKAEEFLLGKPGTKVWLTIQRSGIDKPLRLAMVRAPVEPETTLGVRRKPDDSWDFMLDPRSKVGYVRVVRFGRHTGRDLSQALARLDQQRIKGLILDLRFSEGRLFDAALSVCSQFVQDAKVVTIRSRLGEDSWQAQKSDHPTKVPMVCLINNTCAGASEVVAACLQDNRRAAVAGERSAGDVGIETLVALKGGQLRFTPAVMVRPSGKNIAKFMTTGKETETWGVVPDPDLEVRLSSKERRSLEKYLQELEIIRDREQRGESREVDVTDRQLEAALSHLRRLLR
jgi:carboxyl-terminal processing protease